MTIILGHLQLDLSFYSSSQVYRHLRNDPVHTVLQLSSCLLGLVVIDRIVRAYVFVPIYSSFVQLQHAVM